MRRYAPRVFVGWRASRAARESDLDPQLKVTDGMRSDKDERELLAAAEVRFADLESIATEFHHAHDAACYQVVLRQVEGALVSEHCKGEIKSALSSACEAACTLVGLDHSRFILCGGRDKVEPLLAAIQSTVRADTVVRASPEVVARCATLVPNRSEPPPALQSFDEAFKLWKALAAFVELAAQGAVAMQSTEVQAYLARPMLVTVPPGAKSGQGRFREGSGKVPPGAKSGQVIQISAPMVMERTELSEASMAMVGTYHIESSNCCGLARSTTETVVTESNQVLTQRIKGRTRFCGCNCGTIEGTGSRGVNDATMVFTTNSRNKGITTPATNTQTITSATRDKIEMDWDMQTHAPGGRLDMHLYGKMTWDLAGWTIKQTTANYPMAPTMIMKRVA